VMQQRRQDLRAPRRIRPSTAMAHFRLIRSNPRAWLHLDHIARHSLRRTEHGWTGSSIRAFSCEPLPVTARLSCRCTLSRCLDAGEFSAIVPPETGEYMYELLNRNPAGRNSQRTTT